jgi:hypothetical protein
MKKIIGISVFMFVMHNIVFAQQLYTMPAGIQSRVASPENSTAEKGDGGKTNNGAKGHAFTTLKAGETKALLQAAGCGVIQRMWFTFDDRSPEMLRGLRLKMYWDGSNVPAVDVPFGDFFCNALGQNTAFENELFASPEGRSYNCYIPMPYNAGAKITLTNTTGKNLALLFYDIDFKVNSSVAARRTFQSEKFERQQKDSECLYFHASFNHQQYAVGTDVELLKKITGKGRFLGVSTGVIINPVYGITWWGEGEVKMYLDGDTKNPTINGTGAEDYIGTGWFEGTFAHRYQGCLVADAKGGHYAFYRFHIPDAIYFYHDFRAIIQQIGGWFAPDVKKLIAAGVPLKPVSLSGDKGFRGLMEKGVDVQSALDKADAQDWLNFYRSDDYAVTAYYYLNRP